MLSIKIESINEFTGVNSQTNLNEESLNNSNSNIIQDILIVLNNLFTKKSFYTYSNDISNVISNV